VEVAHADDADGGRRSQLLEEPNGPLRGTKTLMAYSLAIPSSSVRSDAGISCVFLAL
jgi:hypothetical protein